MPKHASYVAVIRRVSDGMERHAPQDGEWDTEGENSWYWWDSGNYSCDCNRYLEFERAGGGDPELDDPNCECSNGRYLVLRFVFPDGSSIDGPDAPEHG
jgi:hypothetical protein